MGLHVLAVNGLLIQHARSYVLRCHGCFRYGFGPKRLDLGSFQKRPASRSVLPPLPGRSPQLFFRTTSEMTQLFCPHCGNKTLKKVAVSVDTEGNLHMHFSRNPKVLNPRGLRVSSWGFLSKSLFPH